jgi:hypothetical protein
VRFVRRFSRPFSARPTRFGIQFSIASALPPVNT